MFSQEYECFCVFSDNATSPLLMIYVFDVFVITVDEFFIACDDQRTTFACIVHGVSMRQIKKTLVFLVRIQRSSEANAMKVSSWSNEFRLHPHVYIQ